MSGRPEQYLRERQRREAIDTANRAQDAADELLDLRRGPGGEPGGPCADAPWADHTAWVDDYCRTERSFGAKRP